MEIMWTSPTAEVLSIRNTKRANLVEITVDYWKNTHGARGREPYRTLPGDVLLLAERKPKTLYELKSMSTWCLSIVKENLPKDGATFKFLAHSLHHPRVDEGAFVIYLMNISTEKRIWKSLKKNTNMNIVKKVLYSDDNMEKKDDCEICNFEAIDEQGFDHLNKSQQGAIKTSLSKTNCTHKSSVELIWGPPGTGKTKTVAVLLFSLLKLKCRTLICAPTNHAIRQVATCVLNLVKSSPDVSVEDVILFGNRERLGIRGDVEEIFLENKVEALKNLQAFDFQEENAIPKVCLESAYLVMCTTSHSYNLHNLQNGPFQFLVIDEAAQLKEVESTIPLQLPGIMHVVLVGDECQLSAMVTSDMSAKWEFGRSLFGRLSLLGHPKKLLNIQYRMHPSISLFPNREFYYNQIMDAECVKNESYGKSYLEGEMFGSYSFINVADGREEKDDDGRSRTNMVEVAVVVTIVKMLHQELKMEV